MSWQLRVGIVFPAPMGGSGGGQERAVSSMVHAMNANGFQVELVCFGNPDVEQLTKLYGYKLEFAKIHTVRLFWKIPEMLRYPISTGLGIIQTVKMSRTTSVTICVDGALERFVIGFPRRTVAYFIRPILKPVPLVLVGRRRGLTRILRLLWVIWWPMPLGPSPKSDSISHNSYAARKIRENFGINVNHVLSLPASASFFVRTEKPDKQVVHVARFAGEKPYEQCLDIFARVAERNQDAKFVMVGLVKLWREYSAVAQENLEKVRRSIRERGLEGRVAVLVDLPFDELVKTFARSRVVLSVQTWPESYVMTLLEGMAAGCVPVAPSVEGGAWEDILEFGKVGFGFRNTEEAAESISRVLELPDAEYARLSERCREKAESVSDDAFANKLGQIVRERMS